METLFLSICLHLSTIAMALSYTYIGPVLFQFDQRLSSIHIGVIARDFCICRGFGQATCYIIFNMIFRFQHRFSLWASIGLFLLSIGVTTLNWSDSLSLFNFSAFLQGCAIAISSHNIQIMLNLTTTKQTCVFKMMPISFALGCLISPVIVLNFIQIRPNVHILLESNYHYNNISMNPLLFDKNETFINNNNLFTSTTIYKSSFGNNITNLLSTPPLLKVKKRDISNLLPKYTTSNLKVKNKGNITSLVITSNISSKFIESPVNKTFFDKDMKNLAILNISKPVVVSTKTTVAFKNEKSAHTLNNSQTRNSYKNFTQLPIVSTLIINIKTTSNKTHYSKPLKIFGEKPPDPVKQKIINKHLHDSNFILKTTHPITSKSFTYIMINDSYTKTQSVQNIHLVVPNATTLSVQKPEEIYIHRELLSSVFQLITCIIGVPSLLLIFHWGLCSAISPPIDKNNYHFMSPLKSWLLFIIIAMFIAFSWGCFVIVCTLLPVYLMEFAKPATWEKALPLVIYFWLSYIIASIFRVLVSKWLAQINISLIGYGIMLTSLITLYFSHYILFAVEFFCSILALVLVSFGMALSYQSMEEIVLHSTFPHALLACELGRVLGDLMLPVICATLFMTTYNFSLHFFTLGCLFSLFLCIFLKKLLKQMNEFETVMKSINLMTELTKNEEQNHSTFECDIY